MDKIALITDTTSDLRSEAIDKYSINVLPFRIIYSDREYQDNIDISPQEVYDNMKIEVPTSSLPSMKDMEDLFLRLEEDGYTHAIAVTLSTGLSGIFNAMKLTSENHPGIITHVCDSQSTKKCATLAAEKARGINVSRRDPPIQACETSGFNQVGQFRVFARLGKQERRPHLMKAVTE